MASEGFYRHARSPRSTAPRAGGGRRATDRRWRPRLRRRQEEGSAPGARRTPGANIGEDAAIFEAVHGSAPDIAGKGIANPTALLMAAGMMLDHVKRKDLGDRLRQTIDDVLNKDMVRTGDLGGTAGTDQYAKGFNPTFVGMTGSPDDIARVAGAYGVFYQRQEAPNSSAGYLVDHSATVLIIDRQGQLRTIWPFDFPRDDMVNDLRALLSQ